MSPSVTSRRLMADRRAVVTDSFVLVPAPGSDCDGQPFQIVITGTPAGAHTTGIAP
jgi:hypothetical protein